MSDNLALIENEIYDNVFISEEDSSAPPKPPRTFEYDQDQLKNTPIKPPRRSPNSSQNKLDNIDLSYLTMNISSIELTHLTKNRAKLPEKRVPARHVRLPGLKSVGDESSSKNLKETAIEYLRSHRTQSMVEFSRIRRTAVKIKQNHK